MRDLPLGRHVPGHSFLHGLDPRIKLVMAPLLVVGAFCVSSGAELAVMGGLALVLIGLSRTPCSFWWKGLPALRWFFLFAVLMHTLMSPGRTLFGTAFLSADGLVHGLRVSAQIALAVVFSSLLTVTTAPGEIAGAFSLMFRPLEKLGLPVRDYAATLLLVLGFIPVLRTEAREVLGRQLGDADTFEHLGLFDKASVLKNALAPMILGLADRADALAHRVAGGESVEEMCASWVPKRCLTLAERCLLLAAPLVLVLLLKGFL